MPLTKNRLLLCLALTLAACHAFALAEDETTLLASQPRVLFVFDASQSMYGKLPNSSRSKLDLAKAFMRTTLGEWPSELQLGLLAYGHRGRQAPGGNRCRDIELLVPIASDTAPLVQRKLSALSANGTTPLCAALLQASEQLQSSTHPGSLVLISDGTEECGGNLLETVRALAATSAELHVNILSLGQSKEENTPLAEFARLTSGRLFDVNEEEEAHTAMSAIMRELVSRGNLSITAHDLWDVATATNQSLTWQLFGVELDAQGHYPLVTKLSGNRLHLQVTPGLYWVTLHDAESHHGFQVHVPQNGTVTERISLTKGVIQLTPHGLSPSDTWSLQVRPLMPGAPNDKPYVSEASLTGNHTLSLPQGHYEMEYHRDGETTKHHLRFHAEAERQRAHDVPFEKQRNSTPR